MKSSRLSNFSKVATLAVVASVGSNFAAHADYLFSNSLSIVSGGTLSLSGASETPAAAALHGLIVQASNAGNQLANIASIRGWINSGYNAGDWLGTGITAPTVATDAVINGVLSVMLYDNTQINYANFATYTGLVAPFEQVFARVTYTGDFDASGTIDGTDYGYLDAYLGGGLLAQGDINADGFVDGSDYGILDAVLGGQVYGNLTAIGSSIVGDGKPPGAVVPEPASVTLLLSGAVALLSARRRK